MTIYTKDQNRQVSDFEMLKSQASQYAMALDLLAKMSHSETEEKAIGNILAIFTELFAPQKLFYLSLTDGKAGQVYSSSSISIEDDVKIKDCITFLTEKHGWTESAKGFSLKIHHQGTLLGIVQIDEIAFPEYKEQYLNLTLSIIDICGLVIGNSRKTDQLRKSEYQIKREKEKVEQALAEVKTLSGLLPICMHCKKIRDDKGYWNQIEAYIEERSAAEFSHGICQECMLEFYPECDLEND